MKFSFKAGICLISLLSILSSCSNYLEEFQDEYDEMANGKTSSSSSGAEDDSSKNVSGGDVDDSNGSASSSDTNGDTNKDDLNGNANNGDANDYASSSSSKTGMENCNDFDGDLWYSKTETDDNLFKMENESNNRYHFEIVDDAIQLNDSSVFCIEYKSLGSNGTVQFSVGHEYTNLFYKKLNKDISVFLYTLAIASDSCLHLSDESSSKCNADNRKDAVNQVDYFSIQNAEITKIMVRNNATAKSSSSEKSSSSVMQSCPSEGTLVYGGKMKYFEQSSYNEPSYGYQYALLMQNDSMMNLSKAKGFCIEYENGKGTYFSIGEYFARSDTLNLSSSNTLSFKIVNNSGFFYDVFKRDDSTTLKKVNAFAYTKNEKKSQIGIKKLYIYGEFEISEGSSSSSIPSSVSKALNASELKGENWKFDSENLDFTCKSDCGMFKKIYHKYVSAKDADTLHFVEGGYLEFGGLGYMADLLPALSFEFNKGDDNYYVDAFDWGGLCFDLESEGKLTLDFFSLDDQDFKVASTDIAGVSGRHTVCTKWSELNYVREYKADNFEQASYFNITLTENAEKDAGQEQQILKLYAIYKYADVCEYIGGCSN